METVNSSVLCRFLAPLWRKLADWYEYSLLAVVIRGIAAGIKNWCAGSGIIRFAAREGVLSRSWEDSLLCHGLTFLLNIPTKILQWIYSKGKAAFDGSFFVQLAFSALENLPLLVGWLMLLFLVIPYEKWSNGYSFAGFVLCFGLSLFAGMRKKGWKLDLDALGPWLAAFGGAVLLAWPLSAYPDLSYRFLKYYGACILCVIVIVSTVERREHLMRLAGISSVALIVMSAYGFYQRASGIEVNPSYVDVTLELNKNMPGRVFSFFENPNAFGEVLLLLIPVAVALMLGSKGWGGRFLGFFAAAVGCVAIIMTYSRASWIGLFFAAALFVLLWNRKIIPACILLVFAAIPFLPESIFNRILTIFDSSDSSTSSRFPLYYAAGEFLTRRPILGAGLGSDAVRQAISDLNLFHGHDKFVHCHNIYLQVWCETGLLGLITFVGGIFWTAKKGAKAVLKAACDPSVRMIILGGITALMGTMLCGMADYIWNYPRVMLIFWFVCALALAGIRLAAREESEGLDRP